MVLGLLVSGTIFLPANPASAAFEGVPGVPAEPTELFRENFENIPHTGPITPLVDYLSAPDGYAYSAEGPWADPDTACNGFVTSASNDMGSACNSSVSSQGGLLALVDVLGQVNGSDPSQNAAVAAYTSGAPYAPNQIMFATDGEVIPLPSANRFVTFSVNAAAVSCWASQPAYRFSVMSGGVEIPISDSAINPCTDPRAATYVPTSDPNSDPVFYAGTFASDGSFLTTGSSVGVILRSESGATAGNDGAFDDIRLLDVTPHLNKGFDPARVPVGQTSRLTFTITNTSELSAKDGWSFTDTLPAGLTMAADPNVAATCDAQVDASANGNTIEVTNGKLGTNELACEISVDVTSDEPCGAQPSPKSYVNGPDNFSKIVGLDGPNEATVEFFSAPDLVVEKVSDAETGTQAPAEVAYTVRATSVGTADYTAENPAIIVDDLSDVLDDGDFVGDSLAATVNGVAVSDPSRAGTLISWEGPLAIGDVLEITYRVKLTQSTDTNYRAINVAWSPADPADPITPECVRVTDEGKDVDTGEPCGRTELLLPGLHVSKSSDPGNGSTVVAGEEVTYTLTFANTGETPQRIDYIDYLDDILDDAEMVGAIDVSGAGLTATQPTTDTVQVAGNLAVDETVTVSYTVTVRADGARGDNVMDNVLAPSDLGDPTCDDAGVLCTTHLIPEIVSWKTVNPASGTTVRAGDILTYTLFFENIGEGRGSFVKDDDLTDVLDDATVVVAPSSTDPALSASSVVDGRFNISGELDAKSVSTVTYQVEVNEDGDRGDGRLANFLLNADETPPDDGQCLTNGSDHPHCTINHVSQIVVTKSSDPASGVEVKDGEKITYALDFHNVSPNTSSSASVDYSDYLAGVLDDATLVAGPQSSSSELSATVVGDVLRVTGTVSGGERYTVSYTVEVKQYSEQGDHLIENVVTVTGEEPVCVVDSGLCTQHPTEDTTPSDASKLLPNTGAPVTGLGLVIGIMMLLVGGAMLTFRRKA